MLNSIQNVGTTSNKKKNILALISMRLATNSLPARWCGGKSRWIIVNFTLIFGSGVIIYLKYIHTYILLYKNTHTKQWSYTKIKKIIKLKAFHRT